MELSHVVLMMLKILIFTSLVLHQTRWVEGAALMGGHMDNTNHSSDGGLMYDEYEYPESAEMSSSEKMIPSESKTDSEEIPDPSPLVLPGYNLPETIFNHGKPFYVEKDPLTGKIDFNHKSPSLKSDEADLYDYVNEEPSGNVYDKKNIDRKDGSFGGYGSHKQADVNQLTPNFHDFLNLPVKYNPDKYVYPLISSSYASTKIQGSVNKFHNHKDTFGVVQKTTTTPKSSVYFTTGTYFTPRTTQRTMATTAVTTTSTTTTRPTTIKRYPELTTPPANILNSGMSHPSFAEEYDYYDETSTISTTTTKTTKPQNIKDVYLTSSTSKPTTTTTKKVLSLFEQLFGDYDEPVTSTKPPKLFSNLPSAKTTSTTTMKTTVVTTPPNSYPNIHAGPTTNVLTGSNMGLDNNYEYVDEDYSNEKVTDNIAVENKVQSVKAEDSLSVEPLKPITKLTLVNKTSIYEDKTKKPTLDMNKNKIFTSVKPIIVSTTTMTTTTPTATRVTSLPLGENHINQSPSFNRDPIIVATQNLREKLNSEKVQQVEPPQLIVELPPQPEGHQPISQLAPSSSNIHIAPGQDTVSFVVGHHQSVGDGGYVGTALKESPYDNFKPLYEQEVISTHLKPPSSGSAITIQPLKNSEASLAIGIPVNEIKQVPGQVMDASLDNESSGQIQFPQRETNKVVFPEEKKPVKSNVIIPPSRLEPQPNREVLKLNSKPMYHQLPSDLTPPKENELVALPPRYGPSDRPIRPPWDPRPGHFYSGKPEYARPPRPPPEVAYKRIDNLPNILPQFRPNMKHHYPMGPPPPPYFNRQPLLERPSNRPIGFFEKIGPPPPPGHVYKRYPPPKNVLRGPPISQQHLLERRPLPPQTTHLDIIEDRRPLAQQPPQSLDDTNQSPMAEDRIINEDPRRPAMANSNAPELNLYQTPPNIHLTNRRNGDAEVETLQMIQAKNEKKENDVASGDTIKVTAEDPDKEGHADKTIYKVYPVNTAPLIDVVAKPDDNKMTSSNGFKYEHQRNDAPILKPHYRPTYPAKSDFPYPLERPDASNNKLEESNQWTSTADNLESRIVSGTGKINYASNQISATLKTYTEKPIAIAYTPTEPNLHADKYSMPNYGSPVIPEIRPGTVENADTGYGAKNEFTVHATMHTNPIPKPYNNHKFNHKIDLDVEPAPQLDFQAPFQASVKLDAPTNQGWSVVRDKNRTSTDELEVTTLPLATTSEFDIENFKPQLIGGFKPLYSMPDVDGRKAEEVPDREE